MKKLTKKLFAKRILKYKKEKTLQKAYKILEQPMSRKFEKQLHSRKAMQIQDKLLSCELIKVAEALRDTAGEHNKDPKSHTWKHLFHESIKLMRWLIINIEDIDNDMALAIILSKFSKKDPKDILKEKKKINEKAFRNRGSRL